MCRAFAEKGYLVFFNYNTDHAGAEKTVAAVRDAGAFCAAIQADVSDTRSVAAFFEKIKKETGRIDVLVNNAGIARDALLPRIREQDMDRMLAVNLKGTIFCMQQASRIMMARRYGRIINITSIAGIAGNPGQGAYAASKAAIIGITKTAARELAARNITVNAVAPGLIATQMTSAMNKEKIQAVVSQIPLKRPGTPEEVAHTVCFLASDSAAYITGQVIHVNGGLYM